MASEFENLFDRLPTELIVYILAKISDVKCLSVCCSVCKLLAALVPQTRIVSLQIPSAIGHSCDESVDVWPPGKMDFLKKLRRVEHATIRFSNCDPRIEQRYSGPLMRWKSDSSNFVLVAAEKRVDEDHQADPTGKVIMTNKYYYAVYDSIRNHLNHYTMRDVLIKELLLVFPNLKKVSAVESTEQGSFFWEEDIDSTMKRDVKPSSEDKNVFHVKLWSAPLVKLPVSGCAMKDVALISIREIEGLDGLMEDNPFEETEYRELAMITMNQPQLVAPLSLPFNAMLDMASYILQTLQFLRIFYH